jgi:sirohydrochlorin ferrochelatase
VIRIGIAEPYKNTWRHTIGVTYMGKKGMLLVGHGSKMPYNQELVEKTAAFIKAKNDGYIVKCGFMNMNKPTIRESLEEFRHEPIEALVVVPLFLAKGVHIEKDIPGEIGLAEGVKKGSFVLNGKSVPLLYADPIGSDPLLAELMIKNADKALSLL